MDDKRECCWIRRKCENLEPCRSWLGLVAAVSAFLLVTLIDTFGVYYDALVEKYDSTRAAVGWIYSFRWTFIFVSAVFITPLIEIFECRTVTMFFGFLYATAIALSAFAPTVGSLYFIFGVLTGIGDSGIYLGTITALQEMFTTNRGFATGFASIGIPLGVLIHPLHTKYFLDLYGVSGVYLMHAAMSLHIMIAAFAYTNQAHKSSKKTKVEDHNVLATVSRPDVKTTKPTNQVPHQSGSSTNTNHKCDVFKTYFKGMTDFTLFKNICFVLAIIHFILLWTIRLGMTSQIVSCATFNGIPDQQAAYLLSISGIVGLCMTAVSGVVMNMSWLNASLFSGSAALCLVVSALFSAFSKTYEAFVVSAVFLGLSDGISTANLPLLVLYVVGLEKFPRGMGLLWTSLVPSAIGSSAFVGWMVDTQGDYIAAFIVLAVAGIVSVLLSVIVAIIITKKKQRKDFISMITVTTKL